MAIYETQRRSHVERESGLEVLRLLSMLLIVSAHMVQFGVGVSDLNAMPLSVEKVFLETVLSGGQIGVVCFFSISAWFLSDPDAPMSFYGQLVRVARLWLSTALLAVPLSLLALASGRGSLMLLLESVAPIALSLYWYVTAYGVFLILAPFLRRCLLLLGRAGHLRLVLLEVALWTFPLGLLPWNVYGMDEQDAWLLLYLFVAVSFVRWYVPSLTRRHGMTMAGLGLAIMLASFVVAGLVYDCLGVGVGYQRWLCYTTKLPIMLIAFGLFLVFKSLRFRSGKVNWIARGAFSVYVLHMHPFVRDFIWGSLFPCDTLLDTPWIYHYVIACSAAVVLAGLAIDVPKRALASLLSPWVGKGCQHISGMASAVVERVESHFQTAA